MEAGAPEMEVFKNKKKSARIRNSEPKINNRVGTQGYSRMRTLWTIGLLVTVTELVGATDPTTQWKLPDAEGRKWAKRVEKAVGRDGWAVEAQGNDIVVRRQKAVALARASINSIDGKPFLEGEGTIDVVLRFAPKMTMDEYERRYAINTASDKEYDRLHRTVGLSHKFDDFIATTAEEKDQVRAFREAVAKLPRHQLPDLYAPDYSIYLLRHPENGVYPVDVEVRAERQAVEDALMRYFGVYRPETE